VRDDCILGERRRGAGKGGGDRIDPRTHALAWKESFSRAEIEQRLHTCLFRSRLSPNRLHTTIKSSGGSRRTACSWASDRSDRSRAVGLTRRGHGKAGKGRRARGLRGAAKGGSTGSRRDRGREWKNTGRMIAGTDLGFFHAPLLSFVALWYFLFSSLRCACYFFLSPSLKIAQSRHLNKKLQFQIFRITLYRLPLKCSLKCVK
jgi:hypothetical protein